MQGLDSRARVVDRILAARKELCGHVGHAAEFENGPDRRAGDQTSAGAGTDLDARRAEFRGHVVQDAPVLGEIDGNHGALRGARGLLDGERGVIRVRSGAPVKIVGEGSLTKKFTVKGIPVSATARAAIEKAGGTIS